MINFHKNELINSVLDHYYETFSHSLYNATAATEKYNQKINKYIFRNMKKAFRQIDRDDRKYQRQAKRKAVECPT